MLPGRAPGLALRYPCHLPQLRYRHYLTTDPLLMAVSPLASRTSRGVLRGEPGAESQNLHFSRDQVPHIWSAHRRSPLLGDTKIMCDHVRRQAKFFNDCRAQACHRHRPESIIKVIQRENTNLRSRIKLQSGSSKQGNQSEGFLLPPGRMQQE